MGRRKLENWEKKPQKKRTKEESRVYAKRYKLKKEEINRIKTAKQRVKKLLKVFSFYEVDQLFLLNDEDDVLAKNENILIEKIKGWGNNE